MFRHCASLLCFSPETRSRLCVVESLSWKELIDDIDPYSFFSRKAIAKRVLCFNDNLCQSSHRMKHEDSLKTDIS